MDQERHQQAIEAVLRGFNNEQGNPYILKGGTALHECYGLDRFSASIYLDCLHANIPAARFFRTIDKVARSHGYVTREGKNTPTVQRVFINYGDPDSPLKVEVSHRRTQVSPDVVCERNDFLTYTISELCRLKAAAYMSRDTMRDLYDLAFISENYFDELSDEAKNALAFALTYKNLEQFDYMMRTQSDSSIDPEELESRFLAMMDRSGLLYKQPSADSGNQAS